MRKLQGTIVSDKMQKTVVVRVDTIKKHSKYHKYYRTSKKYKAHNEAGDYRMGDVVVLEETKPMSKEKKWKVVELIKRPQSHDASEEHNTQS